MTRSRILLDTSALTHYFALAPRGLTTLAVERLGQEGELVIAPQCLYEFYAVATRPATSRGGLGLSSDQAVQILRDQKTSFGLLAEPDDLFDVWIDLVIQNEITGRSTHDARLAAFAIAHGIGRIATRDRGGFARFGLEEIEP